MPQGRGLGDALVDLRPVFVLVVPDEFAPGVNVAAGQREDRRLRPRREEDTLVVLVVDVLVCDADVAADPEAGLAGRPGFPPRPAVVVRVAPRLLARAVFEG